MKIIMLIFLISIIISAGAAALECDSSSPRIGKLGEIIDENRNSKIYELKDPVFFDADTEEQPVSIDYEDIVKKYKNKELIGKENVNHIYDDEKKIPIPNGIFGMFRPGDIIIVGPPYNLCEYEFLGSYDTNGQLKYGLFHSYGDYRYGAGIISADIGDQVNCNGFSCDVKIDFDINGEKFSLAENENFISRGNIINTILVLNAEDFGSKNGEISQGDTADFFIEFKPKTSGEPPVQKKSNVKVEEKNKEQRSDVVIEESEENEEMSEVTIEDQRANVTMEEPKKTDKHKNLYIFNWIYWFAYFFPGAKL